MEQRSTHGQSNFGSLSTPTENRIDALYGSLASTAPVLTAEQLREIAAEAIAEEGALRNAPR